MIRRERPSERATVRALVALAFGRELEARLLDELRASPGYLPELSLVSEEDGRIVGHVLLTRVPMLLDAGGTTEVMMLSPLAVQPDAQGRGIGRALVTAGVEAADKRRDALVVLEGDPAMYRKFGFEPASAYGIARPCERIPDAAFQVRTLTAYELTIRGTVFYPYALCELGAVGAG